MKSTDVLISGGGIPGLTLGVLLADAGLDVALCDPAPPVKINQISASGRTAAVMEGSLGVLAAAGLLEPVAAQSEDIETLAITHESYAAEFHAREISQSRFGMNIQNALLQAHADRIFSKLKSASRLRCGLTDFKVDGSHVATRLSDGTALSARLLIGADGRSSPTRETAGIGLWRHDYGQTAITGVVAHTRPHHRRSTEFHYPGGAFTLVPMSGNRSSFVWMEKTEDAARLLALDPKAVTAIMQEKSRDIVGALTLSSALASYPVIAQKARRLTAPRVALMAEAAHVLSPIGAQGLNLSLRDVAALSRLIIVFAKLGLDIGGDEMLKRYAAEREADLELRLRSTDALNRSVTMSETGWIRRVGFQIAKLPIIKTLLMREALAPSHSLFQDMLSGPATRATDKTSTRAAPAA